MKSHTLERGDEVVVKSNGRRCTIPELRVIPESEPLRVAYSRDEIVDLMNAWMLKLWGEPNPDTRDQFHRDNGMIHHFLCEHFPKDESMA